MKETVIEWFANQLYENFEMRGNGDLFDEIIQQAKEMENDYKLKNQLFKGKVMDIIGWDKTLELLKECENAFKNK